MDSLTDQARAALDAQLRSLDETVRWIDAAAAPLRDAFKPYQNALDQVEETRCLLLPDGAEVAGRCETCDQLLLSNDEGHRDSEAGMVFCAKHSPTYADWQGALDRGDGDYDSEAEIQACRDQIQMHLDQGGSLDATIPLARLG